MSELTWWRGLLRDELEISRLTALLRRARVRFDLSFLKHPRDALDNYIEERHCSKACAAAERRFLHSRYTSFQVESGGPEEVCLLHKQVKGLCCCKEEIHPYALHLISS